MERNETRRKLALVVLSAMLMIAIWPKTAATHVPQKPEELAQKSAEEWLSLTDQMAKTKLQEGDDGTDEYAESYGKNHCQRENGRVALGRRAWSCGNVVNTRITNMDASQNSTP